MNNLKEHKHRREYNKNKCYTALAVLFILCIYSQKSVSQNIISGKVYDFESKKPIEFYSVSLINEQDSSIFAVGNFVTERFQINCPVDSGFIISISSFGYKDTIMRYPDKIHSTSLGEIFLNKADFSLKEVVVTAKPPVLVNKGDKLIVLTENSTISNAGTAIDALQRTPMVLFDNISKSISLAGKHNVLILVNGKRLNNERELSFLNSSQIKQIEIIENPSAKYEAEGQAVINIVTTKRTIEGLSGSLYSNLSFDRKNSQNISVDLTYNKSKILLNGQYSLGNYNNEGYNTTIEKYDKGNYHFYSHSNDIRNHYYMRIHNYKLGLEYGIDNHNTINVETSGFWGNGGNHTYSSLHKVRNGVSSLEYIERNGKDNPYRNTTSLAYELSRENINFSLITDYTKSKDRLDDDIFETDSSKAILNTLKNNSTSEYDLYTVKTDFSIPLKSLKSSMEFGGKYSNVNSDNELNLMRLSGADWKKDDVYSNNIKFEEQILGVYGLFSGNLKNVSYTLGLRYEKYWTQFDNEGNKNYLTGGHFFPNVSLTYKHNDNTSLRLSYTRRINRPSYSSLNNSLIYINSWSARQGNTNLSATIHNSIAANISYKKMTSSLSLSYMENPVDMLYINDSVFIEKHTIKYLNVKNRWMVAYTLSTGFDIKRWSSQPFVALEYSPYSIVEDNITYTTKRLMVYIRSNNQFSLKNDFSIDFNILYRRPAHSFKIFGDQVVLDYGISKSFFNKSLIVQLSHHLEFLKWRQKMDYSYKYIDFAFDASNRNRLSLSVRYFFKKPQRKYSGKSSNKEEIDRL